MSTFDVSRGKVANDVHVAPGDCGSWVIDGNGKVCAMVVAASEDDDEIYCLPLAPIFRNIQAQIGSEGQPEMPLDGELLAKPDQDSSIDGLHKGQSLTVNGLRSSPSGDSNGTMIGHTPIRQERSTNDDVLIDSDSSHSQPHPRRAESERNIKSTTPGMQNEEGAPVKNTSAADEETEKSTKVGEPSAGHNSQMDKQKTPLSSNRDSKSRSFSGLGINQKAQEKRATASTVSFRFPELESSSALSRERERETLVREGIREKPRSPPTFLREDYGRTSAGPVVLARREREDIEFAPRPRPRSPSPEPERKVDKDQVIIRERPPSWIREREQKVDREDIMIRRDETVNDRRLPPREREREETNFRRDDKERDVQPSPPRESNFSREEIIIRRDEDDRGEVENFVRRLIARFLQLGES